ncbi:SLAM family member 5 [Ctenodactylus gundi]
MAWHYLWICLLFLQTWLEATGRDTDLIMVNGILGESVTFPLNIQEPQSINNIAWTSGTSVAVIKPRDSGAAPEILVTHNNYHERITVISQNYSLVLSNLRMEDAGDYKADINIKADTTTKTSPRTITKHFHLGVYRRLGKPKITQSLMTSENSTCNVTLTCSVDEEEKNVTYTWSTQKSENNVLQVLQTPENKDMIYTCTASNPVSNNSSSISAQQLCAGFHWKAFNKKSGLRRRSRL